MRPFAEPSFLFPGEDLRDYEVLRQMIVDDIQPQANIEWLWTLDLVEFSWEILRYRRLTKCILDVHRPTAIEAILRRLDGEGMPAELMPMVHLNAKRTAEEWRDDQDAASETEARLRRSQFDNIDINAEVFVQARASFEMFDRVTHWRRLGELDYSGKSAYDENLPGAPGTSLGRWTACDLSAFVKHGPKERVNVAGTLRLLRASPNAEYSLSCAPLRRGFFLVVSRQYDLVRVSDRPLTFCFLCCLF